MAFVPTIIRANSMMRNIWRMPSCLSPISQPLAAEGHLARVGRLEAHLVLDVRRGDAVALAELARRRVEVELRHQEQRQPLRPRAGTLRTREDVVEDVLREVV